MRQHIDSTRATILVWRVMAEYGAICPQIKEKIADLPYFARRDTTRLAQAIPEVREVPISDIGSAIRSPRRCGPAPPIRRTGVMEDLPVLPDQSALTPANFTTLPHFSVSSTMSLPKSLGEPVSAMPPRSASRAFILGSATPASISLLSLSMISTGVLLGAPTPNQ